ncbi:MAG: hypothetical protein GY906_31375, partial [bacterium]|nr:hypothetical protein [bacterium]
MKKTYRDSGAAKCHTAEALAYSARAAQRALGSAPGLQRTRVLKRLNSLLAERRQELLRVNRQDIKIAARQSLAPALLQRLELTSAKLDTLMAGVDQIAASDDPVGRIQRHTELDDGLRLSQVSSPIGVLLVIFESRPDVV